MRKVKCPYCNSAFKFTHLCYDADIPSGVNIGRKFAKYRRMFTILTGLYKSSRPYFDYPDYGNLHPNVSNTFSPQMVDAIQEWWDARAYIGNGKWVVRVISRARQLGADELNSNT